MSAAFVCTSCEPSNPQPPAPVPAPVSAPVVNLLVKAGDTITAGQGLLELESEKAVATIPAPAGGVVGRSS